MTRQSNHLYEFGPFRLDPAERLLLRDGQAVQLTAKAFDTLLVLVENSGQVVKKDFLLDQVWSDTAVEESTLAQNIFTLRKTLGDDSQENRFIETVPRQGYRFVSEVRQLRDASPAVIDEERIVVQAKDNWEGGLGPDARGKEKPGPGAFKPVSFLIAASVLLVGLVAALIYLWPSVK